MTKISYSNDGVVTPPVNDGQFTPPVNNTVKTDFNGSIFPGMKGYAQPVPSVNDYVVMYPKSEIDTLLDKKINVLPTAIQKKTADYAAAQQVVLSAEADLNNCNNHIFWNCDSQRLRRDKAKTYRSAIEIELQNLQKELKSVSDQYDLLKSNFEAQKQKAIDNYNIAVQTWSTNAAEWYRLESDRVAAEKKRVAEEQATLASKKAAEDAKIQADKTAQEAELQKAKLAAMIEASKAGLSEDSASKVLGTYIEPKKDNTSTYTVWGVGIILFIVFLVLIFKN